MIKSNLPDINNCRIAIIGLGYVGLPLALALAKKKLCLFTKKRLKRELAIDQIQKSYIGLLINTDSNLHSVKYTSPLKYFEYMYSGLQVIASNFLAHSELPFAKNIHFFEDDNEESFINSIKIASKSVEGPKGLESITLEKRAREIVNFIS